MSLTISPPPLLLVVCAYTHVLSNHNPPPPYSPSPTRRQVSYLVTRVTSCWWLSLAYLVVNCLQTCSFSPFPPFYPSPPHLSHPSTPAPTPPTRQPPPLPLPLVNPRPHPSHRTCDMHDVPKVSGSAHRDAGRQAERERAPEQ